MVQIWTVKKMSPVWHDVYLWARHSPPLPPRLRHEDSEEFLDIKACLRTV